MRERTGVKITIVIPAYKAEPYLRQCLDSIISQTYQNLEIIAVDDGSPDRCGEIFDEYAAKDERFRVVHKQNAGVSAARNDGIELATGKWIFFVDPDDWLDIGFIEKMVQSLHSESMDVLLAGGFIEEYPTKSLPVYSFQSVPDEYDKGLKDTLIKKVLMPQFGEKGGERFATIATAWNKLYRTSFLRAGNLRFNTKLHPQEDVLFCLELFDRAPAVGISDCVGYHYRQMVQTSALHRFNSRWPYMTRVFLGEVEKLMEKSPANESLRQAVLGRVAIITSQILQCYFFHPDNKNSYRVTKRELEEYKSQPVAKAFINDNDKNYLSTKQAVLRGFLRLPWMWPVKLLTVSYNKTKGK